MKIKTAELTGAALNWAVAKCEGYDYAIVDGAVLTGETRYEAETADDTYGCESDEVYEPSTDWSQGGPIIEREGISVAYIDDNIADGAWFSSTVGGDENAEGPTPLIAAMRCYVASKLGDEVEILPELVQSNPI